MARETKLNKSVVDLLDGADAKSIKELNRAIPTALARIIAYSFDEDDYIHETISKAVADYVKTPKFKKRLQAILASKMSDKALERRVEAAVQEALRKRLACG